MDSLKPIDANALIKLKGYRHHLTVQEYKTLRGVILAGNADGAMRGLRKILSRRASIGHQER